MFRLHSISGLTACVVLVALVVASGFFLLKPVPVTNYPSSGTDIIAFGDSLVQGVGATPGNDFVSVVSRSIGAPIINLGKAGDTTADGVARLADIDRYNPKIVIVLLGGNDYLRKIPITETYKNLSIIIEHIHSRGAIVLLLGVRGGLLRDSFEDQFTQLRDTYHTAFVSNVLDGLLANPQYMSDAIHPNDTGYRAIAERVYIVLKKLYD